MINEVIIAIAVITVNVITAGFIPTSGKTPTSSFIIFNTSSFETLF